MASRTVEILIKGNDKASPVFANVGKNAAKMGGGIGGLGKMIAPLAGIAAGAMSIQTAFGFAKSSLAEFMEAETQAAKLGAALNSETGVTAAEIKNLADEMENLTAFEGDATVGAAALLASFRNVRGEIFKGTITAAMDMAARTGKDLTTTIQTLGKALNDPLRGMTALRRAGITLDTQQQTLVKSLVATGETAKAQQVILNELAEVYGGAAAAQADTMAGKVQQLSNSWGNFKETLAGLTASKMPEWLDTLTESVKKLTEAIDGPSADKQREESTSKVNHLTEIDDARERLWKKRAERISILNRGGDQSWFMRNKRTLLADDPELQQIEEDLTAVAAEEARRKAELDRQKRIASAQTAQRTGPIPGIVRPAVVPGARFGGLAAQTPQQIATESIRNAQQAEQARMAEAQRRKIENDRMLAGYDIATGPSSAEREAVKARQEAVRQRTAMLRAQQDGNARLAKLEEHARRTQEDIAAMRKTPVKVKQGP